MRRAASFFMALAAACFACAGAARAAPPVPRVPQIVLVQNSGWMEPFYADPQSPFKPLVGALAGAVAQPGDALVLAAFNQSLPGAPSPRGLLSETVDGGTARHVRAALAALDTARKPNGAALADTDLGEAVEAAVLRLLQGRPGIVWLVTNNRNSPNNDQETGKRNREFYTLIHRGAAIRMALAFPLRMPVTGRHYRANGLMVYALAVGEGGERALGALLAGGPIRQVFTEPPARLKPLDRNTVRLVPRRVEGGAGAGAAGVAFSMDGAGRLHADVAPDARRPSARITWQLENTMYPYTIAGAHLSARSLLGGENRPIALADPEIGRLAPGQAVPLASTMSLPVAQLPGKWSLAALQAAGSAWVLPGRIELHLENQRLELSQAFRERMAALFPGDPLPDIFTPPAEIAASTAVLPLEVSVHYGSGPLLALVGGGLLVAALGAGAAWAYGRPRRVRLRVEDELRTVHARAGATQPIYDKAGNQIARLKTTLFGHQLLDLREGAQVRLES